MITYSKKSIEHLLEESDISILCLNQIYGTGFLKLNIDVWDSMISY
jgi:hypothetical protein